jgi:hypothetical protein
MPPNNTAQSVCTDPANQLGWIFAAEQTQTIKENAPRLRGIFENS